MSNHMATGSLPPFEDTSEWWAQHDKWRRDYNTCATCGSNKVHVENHSSIWGDGDVICENGHKVRDFDSG